jgi:hypothetical protein
MRQSVASESGAAFYIPWAPRVVMRGFLRGVTLHELPVHNRGFRRSQSGSPKVTDVYTARPDPVNSSFDEAAAI